MKTEAGAPLPSDDRFERTGSLVRGIAARLGAVPEPPDRLRRYGVSVLCVAVGALVSFIVHALSGRSLSAPIILGVLVATWYGGWKSGLAAIVLGVPVTWFLAARGDASVSGADGTAIFITVTSVTLALVTGVFYESAREAQRRNQRAVTETLMLIEQQRALTEQIALSEARYSSLAETMPAHVVITDAAGGFEYCNQSYFDYTGLTLEQAKDWQEHTIIHPDDVAGAMERWAHAMSTGGLLRSEMRLRRHDGEYRAFLVTGTPVRGDDGAISRWITVSVDIDDRKAAEAARVASEERFELAAAATRIGTWEWDMGERVVWSESLEAVYGYAPGEFPGTFAAFADRTHPDDREMVRERVTAALESGDGLDMEHRILLPSGEVRWLNGRGQVVRDADGKPVRMVGIGIDITDRKRAADLLRLSENRYRALTGALPSIVSTADASGRIDYFNDRWYEYTGLDSEASKSGGWQDVIHPDDWDESLSLLSASFESGNTVEHELRLRRHDGQYRWYLARMLPITDADGATTAWVIGAIDIDARVNAERAREELVHDLEAANAAKDEFLGLVSHELKTPITTILGNAFVLEKRGDLIDEESKRQALRDIHHDADRLHRIIDNLLVLARLEQGQAIEVEPMIVGRLVDKLVEEHAKRYPDRHIEMVNEGDRRPVTASPFHVEHIFRNLLSNAEKYSPEDAEIEVRIVRSEADVSVMVRDRGSGVPEDEQKAIFTPFYRSPRTEHSVAGIGIGLAVCKRLIEAQGGKIWMRSRDGGGSEFGFSLPVPDMNLDGDDIDGRQSAVITAASAQEEPATLR